jgi:hypothetical protein
MYGNGCCGGYCEPEEMTQEDQEAFLQEREAILEAKLATVRHLRETLKKQPKSDKK